MLASKTQHLNRQASPPRGAWCVSPKIGTEVNLESILFGPSNLPTSDCDHIDHTYLVTDIRRPFYLLQFNALQIPIRTGWISKTRRRV